MVCRQGAETESSFHGAALAIKLCDEPLQNAEHHIGRNASAPAVVPADRSEGHSQTW